MSASLVSRGAATVQERVSARLGQLTVVEGLLPTRAAPSDPLAELARALEDGDAPTAEAAERRLTKNGNAAFGRPVADIVPGNDEVARQTAAFARAGIGFVKASARFLGLDLDKRRAAGGNGSVSRVLMAGDRLLLETNRVVIRFAPSAFKHRTYFLGEKHLFEIEGAGLPPDTVRAAITTGQPAVDICQELMLSGAVLHAEPDFIEHIGSRQSPGHLDGDLQWHHTVIGAPAAWRTTRGENISLAVIDNGFDGTHPDLTAGALSGWFQHTPDFADADFIAGTVGIPGNDHGTACAGMIGAAPREGKRGVAHAVQLQLIACLGDQIGSQSTLARAIGYATSPSLEGGTGVLAGADVIVCSLGPNSAAWRISETLNDAIAFAASTGRNGLGCTVFWACTNGNHPIAPDEVCSHPDVMAVGRSTENDEDHGCGFGKELEFLAPGVDVLLPRSGGGYDVTTGTSFAAPCAAAVAALALSQHPDMSATQLRDLLRGSCDKIGNHNYKGGRSLRTGWGRINAERAVSAARQLVPEV